MSVNYSDLAITSLETITAFDVTTGAFMWVLDELQSATISHSEDMQSRLPLRFLEIAEFMEEQKRLFEGAPAIHMYMLEDRAQAGDTI